MSKQIHDRRVPFERPPRIRSMLTLVVASEVLALAPASAQPRTASAEFQFREQTKDLDAWYATMVAGGTRDTVLAVAENPTTLGIVAPRSLADQAHAEGLPICRLFSFDTSDAICSASAPDDFVVSVCRAIDSTTADCRVHLQERNSPVPLHPAAKQFWFGE